MQNSGCKVPEYMLTMKKASKRTRRQLEKTVPKREDIRVKGPNDIRKKNKAKGSNGSVAGKRPKPSSTNGAQNGEKKNFKSKKHSAPTTKRKTSEASDGVQKKKQKKSD